MEILKSEQQKVSDDIVKFNDNLETFYNNRKTLNENIRKYNNDVEKFNEDVMKFSDDKQKFDYETQKVKDSMQKINKDKQKTDGSLENLRDVLENKEKRIKKLENFTPVRIGSSIDTIDFQNIRQSTGVEISDLFTIQIIELNEDRYLFCDFLMSLTVGIVYGEFGSDDYQFSKIAFEDEDIVIDIGLNIGMNSIYLAKNHPYLKIYAYEPQKTNYNNYVKNAIINNIGENIITAENKAVTSDGRSITMEMNKQNSGASRMKELIDSVPKEDIVESVTLDSVFEKYNISKVKLLKIDCEGAV
jgi:FkbM family methyltransferase